MTLVELLVGMAIGLFLVAGSGSLMLGQLNEHRRLLLETQVQQDLRAISVLIRREAATAGSWGEPAWAAWSSRHRKGRTNPYAHVETSEDGSHLSFAASRSATRGDGDENHVLDDADRKSFRWRGGTLEFRTDGGRFQPLNDPGSVRIQRFEARIETARQALEDLCPKACEGWENCPPQRVSRVLLVHVEAQAAKDPHIHKSWDWQGSLDTDVLEGECRP